jgi:hypothetical protein
MIRFAMILETVLCAADVPPPRAWVADPPPPVQAGTVRTLEGNTIRWDGTRYVFVGQPNGVSAPPAPAPRQDCPDGRCPLRRPALPFGFRGVAK